MPGGLQLQAQARARYGPCPAAWGASTPRTEQRPSPMSGHRDIPTRAAPWALCLLAVLLAGCGEPPRPTIALYPAIERGDLEQIERHVHWGSDINALDPDGQRPLHAAAEAGRSVVVRTLLDGGAEIDAPDREGHTALYVALMQGRTQVAELLVQRGAELEPTRLLQEVVDNGVYDRDVLDFLMEQGADINAENAAGDPPLLRATRQGNRLLAKHLIARGAEVNARGAQGHTPLWWALEAGNEDVARLLRRQGGVAE